MGLRLAAVALLGACIGSAVNWAIYRLAWNRRPIGPWTRRHPSAPPRRWFDRLPIVGWLGLRREAAFHGSGFWIRPMLLEILTAAGYAALYWWEVGAQQLLPSHVPQLVGASADPILQLNFLAHSILIGLMLAASMIDADEMMIPDEITISGTLIGLLFAAAWPASLLPIVTCTLNMGCRLEFLQLTSPNERLAWLDGAPHLGSLVVGLLCWWGWCFALLPRTWYARHGAVRALQLSWARLTRETTTYRILRMGAMGTLAVILVWYRGNAGWEGLLTALVGLAVGGGLIWLVRIIGRAVLHREAMGFGDVTLMAMIGAFLGWQNALVIFFLAPIAGLLIGLLRLIFFRDREIPYGPFLCLASLFVIVRWPAVWEYTHEVFTLGWLVLLLMLGCLGLMAVILGLWRLILSAFR